ncbi:hypothetical protein BDN72DRAFT_232841 [Pluteus cervinus]|uniref:Uncharacterized protein n=1 Tax=Pluteus cervinus TaxID=181527 RepID=A0ACD3BEX7_9AGAR|nr:hypothetical protein BDN72DRAFT_232841 [Pluteus cervinus]
MSPDNSNGLNSHLKKAELQECEPNRRRGSGLLSQLPPIHTSLDQFVPIQSMTIVPRPFPPPLLAGVPLEYICDQLRGLAPRYWGKPETSDCTLIVPIPQHQRGPTHPSTSPLSPTIAGSGQSSGLGRRATEPSLHYVPEMTLKLHMDYLSAHSSYLRGLFGGASPLDLLNGSHNPSLGGVPDTRKGRFTVPPDRFPRILPSSPNHPIIYLPVPDPSSFQLLIHWMYFGDNKFIDDCLKQGLIQWEGIARNVEYLGMSKEIKIFLGHFYRCWLQPSDFSDQESDGDASDSDEVPDRTAVASPGPVTIDKDSHEPSRGRTRTTRPLSMQRAPRSGSP